MSDFKAKMHQIRFRLGLRPRPRWGSLYSAPPDPPAGFEGPTSKAGEGKGEGMRGEGRRRREGRGGLSGNEAEESLCLNSAPVSSQNY